MPEAKYRRRFTEWQYGPTCIDCGAPKSGQATRCLRCWHESRRDAAYWARRTCPDCGGPMCRHKRQRCKACADERLRGRPRSTPVTVPSDHIWRRRQVSP